MLSSISSSGIYFLPLFFVPFLLFKWFYSSSIASKNQPPSPRKLPIIGNLHQLTLLPHRALQLLSKQYGKLMLLHLGSKPVLIVSSAEAACEIMKTHDLIFASRPKIIVADRFLYGSKDVAFAPYGEYWRQVRSLFVLHLLSNKRVQSYSRVRKEETMLMIDKIAKLSIIDNALINLTDLFALLANDIVCRVSLGKKYSDDGETGRNFKHLIKEYTELLGTFNVGDYIPWLSWLNSFNGLDARLSRAVKRTDKFLVGVVEEHRKKKKTDDEVEKDFVDILLELQRDFSLQEDSIKALTWEMFAAGTETTSTTLEWAMSELIRNPLTMEKLQNEVRLIAQGKPEIYENDLVKMHYLKAVIKETLRLHPAVPLLVPREVTQNVKLMGYEIKKGTQVFINAWAIGRDPSLWDMCEEFQPGRFLNSNIDYKGYSFELIPFGAGRRGCPGATFSLILVELALANLVLKFNFTLPDGLRGEDLDMTEGHGITIAKKFPLVIIAELCSG